MAAVADLRILPSQAVVQTAAPMQAYCSIVDNNSREHYIKLSNVAYTFVMCK